MNFVDLGGIGVNARIETKDSQFHAWIKSMDFSGLTNFQYILGN